jgi:hypothetical protein
MLAKIPTVAKAVAAFATAAGGALATALTDGVVTLPEWIAVAVAAVVATTAVYQVPNRPDGRHEA